MSSPADPDETCDKCGRPTPFADTAHVVDLGPEWDSDEGDGDGDGDGIWDGETRYSTLCEACLRGAVDQIGRECQAQRRRQGADAP